MAVMIVASPGRLRDGLQVMLASFLGVEPLVAGDDSAATEATLRALQPDLVILDSGLFGAGTEALVRAIKSKWKQMGCIVVVDRITHTQAVQDAGADCVLLQGFPATRLFGAVEQLLRRNTDDSGSENRRIEMLT